MSSSTPANAARRQRLDPSAQRRARDRHRVDLIGLPALDGSNVGVRRHQPRRDAHDAFAATDQEPLERARDMPAVLQAPRPARHRARAPSPATSRTLAAPTWTVLLAQHLTGRDVDRGERVRALVGVRPEHDHDPRPHPFHPDAGRSADTACWGRCHAPIKSRRTSPTGDERHNKRKSGPQGRQPQRESARRPVGTLSTSSDVTDTPNPNSKPRSSSAALRRSAPRRAIAIRPS